MYDCLAMKYGLTLVVCCGNQALLKWQLHLVIPYFKLYLIQHHQILIKLYSVWCTTSRLYIVNDKTMKMTLFIAELMYHLVQKRHIMKSIGKLNLNNKMSQDNYFLTICKGPLGSDLVIDYVVHSNYQKSLSNLCQNLVFVFLVPDMSFLIY